METEALTLSPTQAALGLAILPCIPLVLFALWHEYFDRYLDERLAEPDPADDPLNGETEIQRIRSTGVFALLLQLGLFFSVSEIRKLAPAWISFAPLIALSLQMWIQRSAERNARTRLKLDELPAPTNTKPTPDFRFFRSFFWGLAAAFSYVFALAAFLTVGAVGASALRTHPALAAAFTICMVFAGVVAGLWLNFALAPYFLKRIMAAKAGDTLVTSVEQTLVATLIERNVKVPCDFRVELVSGRDAPFAGAIMSGLPSGRRWLGARFTPTLFLTEPMIRALEPSEQLAVLAHELAHFKLSHLRRRLVFATVVILGVSFTATFAVLMAHAILQTANVQWIGLFSGAIGFLSAFRLLGHQSRMHELEADLFCVETLALPLESLAQALRKLDRTNLEIDPRAINVGWSHPSTEERISRLKLSFEAKLAAAVKTAAAQESANGRSVESNTGKKAG